MSASDEDPAFDRFAGSFRRLWLLVLVAAVVGAIGFAGLTRAEYKTGLTIVLPASGPALTAAGYPADLINFAAPERGQAESYRYGPFAEAVRDASANVEYEPSVDTNNNVRVSFTGDDPDQLARARDAFAEVFIRVRLGQIDQIVAPVRDSLTHADQLLADRIGELDRQLAETPVESVVLGQAYLAERSQRASELVANQTKLAALEAYAKAYPSSVQLVRSTIERTIGTSAALALGAVIGAVLAMLAIAVIAIVDSMVRTRSELRRIAQVPCLGTFGLDDGSSLVAALLDWGADGDRRVHVITPSHSPAIDAVRRACEHAEGDIAVGVLDGYDVDMASMRSGRVVLAAAWGATRRTDALAATESLVALGVPATSCVLIGVPARHTSTARR